MKWVKRVIVLSLLVIVLTGCTLFNKGDTPTDKVSNLLKKYQEKDITVTNQLDEIMMDETLTSTQTEDYRTLILNQYSNLKYNITNETVTDDKATVTAQITVLDYAGAIAMAQTYYETNPSQFYDSEGNPSTEKYMDYKITQMKAVTNTRTYTVDFTLTKVNNEWEVDDLTDAELLKIHGLYQ